MSRILAENSEETEQERNARWQRERIERAMREGPSYRITWHAPLGKWLVENPATGGRYLVTPEGECSCPDSLVRGRHARCKHAIAANLHRLFAPSKEKR